VAEHAQAGERRPKAGMRPPGGKIRLMSNTTGATTDWVTGWLGGTSGSDNTNVANLIDPRRALMGRCIENPALFRCPAGPSLRTAGGRAVPRVRSADTASGPRLPIYSAHPAPPA
jgi:hypothetical protein